jgi:AcrR family transcriptional regulator
VTRRRPRENVRKARSELYRQLILDAAERVFAEKGFDDAKMEEIAAESGLSLGTLYSVFQGKWRLFDSVHETRNREVLELATEAARGRSSPLEVLLAAVRAYVEFFAAHPEFLRMHLREGHAWGLAEAGAPTRERAAAWNEGVSMQAALFERGIRDGVFHPGEPRLLARLMIAMHQVHLAAWVEGGMQGDVEQLIAEMQTQVRRTFCRDPEAA